MEGTLADELYSETLRLSHVELDIKSDINNTKSDSNDCNEDDLWHEDDTLWDSYNMEVNKASDLDREWQRRRDQFHTIGYRDGVIAGKEASAQEGFNIGFKDSVLFGYKWGIVRGVTSALACLPDGMKENLVETQENRNKLQSLYESLHTLSTTDALKLFHNNILTEKTAEQSENAEPGSDVAGLLDQSSEEGLLGSYLGKLQSLLCESPAVFRRNHLTMCMIQITFSHHSLKQLLFNNSE